MKNYDSHGETMSLTAPTGGVVGGTPYLIGIIFGVASFSADAGKPFELRRKGVFRDLPKKTGEAWTEGAQLYWDDSAKVLTTTATSNKKAAAAAAAAASGDATGKALLLPFAI